MWLRPDVVPSATFLQCESSLTSRTDKEFREARLPLFYRSGRGDANLEDFSNEVDGWLPTLVPP